MICKSKAIESDKVKKFFVYKFNKINKSEHYRNIKIAIDTLCDATFCDKTKTSSGKIMGMTSLFFNKNYKICDIMRVC